MKHLEKNPWSMTKKQEQAREPHKTGMTTEYDFTGAESVFGGADDESEPKDGELIKH